MTPMGDLLGHQVMAACASGAWPASWTRVEAWHFTQLYRYGQLRDARHVAGILSAVQASHVTLTQISTILMARVLARTPRPPLTRPVPRPAANAIARVSIDTSNRGRPSNATPPRRASVVLSPARAQ